jgi:uncharacterized protein
MRTIRTLLAAIVLAASALSAAAQDIDWRPWSPDIFSRAKAENRLVILDLEAVWCHWCHVMDKTTYRDPEVTKLLAEHFIAVKADQDANPDLSNRYGDWGWPATILYAPDGTEIAKLRGYRDPDQMESILKAFIADPTPGPSVEDAEPVKPSLSMFLSETQRAALKANWRAVYDAENGGWGDAQKFIHGGSMDFALALAEAGDAEAAGMARQTLDASLKLIDPVWGGIYQYSDKPDWSSPHFEKIMSFQAQTLRQYAFASRLFEEPRYAQAARDIARYLVGTLGGPEGAFYATQDADLSATVPGKQFYALDAEGRAKLGMPRIDKNIYARENGQAISALAAFAGFAGDTATLAAAEKAALWIIANRSLPGGGFAHGANDRAGPYLGDTLAMGQGLLDLYAATGKREWLAAARGAGLFIGENFKGGSGFGTSKAGEAASGPLSKPFAQIDENIDAARFLNALARYSGEARFRDLAGHAMRALASEQIVQSRRFLGGLLAADAEVSIEPVHMTIVGRKSDPDAAALHQAARAYPALYRRIDWWDTGEGPLANPDVQYPELEEAAAYACSNNICSRPAFDAESLAKIVKSMLGLRVKTQE